MSQRRECVSISSFSYFPSHASRAPRGLQLLRQVLRWLELGWRHTERFGLAPSCHVQLTQTLRSSWPHHVSEATTTSRTFTCFSQPRPRPMHAEQSQQQVVGPRASLRWPSFRKGCSIVAWKWVTDAMASRCELSKPLCGIGLSCSAIYLSNFRTPTWSIRQQLQPLCMGRVFSEALEEKRTSVLARPAACLIPPVRQVASGSRNAQDHSFEVCIPRWYGREFLRFPDIHSKAPWS